MHVCVCVERVSVCIATSRTQAKVSGSKIEKLSYWNWCIFIYIYKSDESS